MTSLRSGNGHLNLSPPHGGSTHRAPGRDLAVTRRGEALGIRLVQMLSNLVRK